MGITLVEIVEGLKVSWENLKPVVFRSENPKSKEYGQVLPNMHWNLCTNINRRAHSDPVVLYQKIRNKSSRYGYGPDS
jgi:hypothetical protein